MVSVGQDCSGLVLGRWKKRLLETMVVSPTRIPLVRRADNAGREKIVKAIPLA